jgi:hypothetical protein
MTKINFKQFITEAAAGKNPMYVDVDVEKAVALLNAHCKNALWMLKENKPIWRGDRKVKFPKSGFKVVDTEATERRSQNTSNYYTVILDNHPDRKQFPKRSRSFIASTDKSYASDYAGGGYGAGSLFAVIPVDDAKIGVVNKDDMWSTLITLFGQKTAIEDANRFFQRIFDKKTSITIKDFIQFDKKLKSNDPVAVKRFNKIFGDEFGWIKERGKYANSFLEEIWKSYSAESTGHTAHTTANMPRNLKSEVWVGGKVVLIEEGMWKKMVEADGGGV